MKNAIANREVRNSYDHDAITLKATRMTSEMLLAITPNLTDETPPS